MPGRVWQSQKPAWVEDVTQDANFQRVKLAERIGLKSSVGVPVLANGDVTIVLEFFLKESRPQDTRLIELISAVAAELGVVIERKRADETVRAAEAKYRALVENIPAVVYVDRADEFSRSYYISPQIEILLGFSPEEYASDPALWHRQIEPRDYKIALRSITDTLERGSSDVEYRLIARDGSPVWVRDTSALIRNEDGSPQFIQGFLQDISERKRAEQKLAASEAELRALFAAMQDVVITIDRDGVYRKIAPTNPALLYRPPEELLGKTLRDIFPPEQAETFQNAILRVLDSREAGHIEYELQIGEKPYWFSTVITPMDADNAVWVAHDITERKRAEETLKKLSSAVEQTADMVFMTDPEGVIEYVNPAFEQTTGYSREDALGATPRTLKSGFQNQQYYAELWQAITSGNVFRTEAVNRKKNGELYHVEQTITPIRDEWGKVTHFVSNCKDVTARKQAEEKLRNLNADLERRIEDRTAELRHLNNELERALRIKDEFLASMSHELRTPLNAVIGLSESLSEQTVGSLNDKQQKYVATIGESGHHLLSLINDILDLAKIEAGQVTLSRDKANIAAICQSSLRMVKQLALKKNQDAQFEMDANLGMIWADERRLKQMIVNLLGNAIKFTPDFGKLGLRVRGDRAEDVIRFTVWDTGSGIHEDDLPRLFKPFVQLDANLARKAGGTGLGLALVAKMAALHGGSVSVESQPGVGSQFTVTLPWESALTTGSLKGRLEAGGPATDAATKGQTILLVDDTEDVILLFKDYLEYAGYKVAVARNGREGVLQAQAVNPSLILMDVQMPVMDGMEAAREIRKMPALARTPIIALTALAMKGDRDRCLEAGMSDYLSKPVTLRTLVEVIEQHLSDHEEDTRS